MKTRKKRFSVEYQETSIDKELRKGGGGETYQMVYNLWRWAPWGSGPCPCCRRVGSPEWKHSSWRNYRSRRCVPPGRTSPRGDPLTAEETPAPPVHKSDVSSSCFVPGLLNMKRRVAGWMVNGRGSGRNLSWLIQTLFRICMEWLKKTTKISDRITGIMTEIRTGSSRIRIQRV
jgi:hypothetical protein